MYRGGGGSRVDQRFFSFHWCFCLSVKIRKLLDNMYISDLKKKRRLFYCGYKWCIIEKYYDRVVFNRRSRPQTGGIMKSKFQTRITV